MGYIAHACVAVRGRITVCIGLRYALGSRLLLAHQPLRRPGIANVLEDVVATTGNMLAVVEARLTAAVIGVPEVA